MKALYQLPIISMLFLAQSANAQNLITNGGFETGGLTGWELTGNAYVIDQNTSDGIYTLNFNGGNVPVNAVLTQSFNTIPGQRYLFSFDFAAHNNSDWTQGVRITLNGATLLFEGEFTDSVGQEQIIYDTHSFMFTADSDLTLLTIRDIANNTNGQDGYIDNISVIPIPQLSITCSGFMPPFDKPLLVNKKVDRAIPVKIKLTDTNGTMVTNLSITSLPVINVLFGGQSLGQVQINTSDLLPLGSANDGNIFRFDSSSEQWEYNLGTKQFQTPGIYTVIVTSGAAGEYQISSPNGACTQTFERLSK